MNVFLRADSSLSIGSGHIIRCLNLARGLEKAGARCCFISKDHLVIFWKNKTGKISCQSYYSFKRVEYLH